VFEEEVDLLLLMLPLWCEFDGLLYISPGVPGPSISSTKHGQASSSCLLSICVCELVQYIGKHTCDIALDCNHIVQSAQETIDGKNLEYVDYRRVTMKDKM
jgi:hypothetical protein